MVILNSLYRFYIWAISILLLSNFTIAQEIYFFSEGTDNNYYDQGIVDVNNLEQSTFEYTHPPGGEQWNDKVPCSTTAYKGTSSLKFSYASSENGNWKVTVNRNDWSTADISDSDSLSFYLYSDTGLPGSALPLIGLNAMNNSGSGSVSSQLYKLADFNGNVPAAKWTQITFPLATIVGDANNSELDFTEAYSVIFNQSENDNSSRLILIDEITAVKKISNVPAVSNFTAKGYDSHAELSWEHPEPGLSYRIVASFDGGQSFQQRIETTADFYMDFVSDNERNKNVLYRIVAFAQDEVSDPQEKTVEIKDFSDDELLDMVQQYAFRYFWEGAHQATGMALE
jgi:hypothetical protein